LRVLVPFTKRHPDIEAAAPAHAEWVDVSEDGFAYWRLLCEWWARGETFMVLEHDVICRPEILEHFESCPEPWCLHPYDDMCHWGCMEKWANSLGCIRFDASLMRAVPDAASSVEDPKLRIWTDACNGLGNNLRDAGFTHHWHFPAVYHHAIGREGRRGFASLDYPPGALV